MTFGHHLLLYIVESNKTLSDVAQDGQMDEERLLALCSDDEDLTKDDSEKLSLAFGTTSQFWVNLFRNVSS